MKLTFCLWILLAVTRTTNVVGILETTTIETTTNQTVTTTPVMITKIPISVVSTPPTTFEPAHKAADNETCNINKDIVFKRLKATSK